MKRIATLLPWVVVLLLTLALPDRSWSGDNRHVSISNDRLGVTLAIPSGRLAVDDSTSGVHWVQYVPVRVAQGRDWGKVGTREIPPSDLVQQTRFANGLAVVVNFGTVPWVDPRGFRVSPEGYRILK